MLLVFFFYSCLEWSFDKYLYAVVDCVSYVYEVACFIYVEFRNHVDYVACVYCKTLDFSKAVDCVSCVYKGLRFLFLAFNNQVRFIACL